MANSAKPEHRDPAADDERGRVSPSGLERRLGELTAGIARPRFVCALSAGMDSTVLLHALSRIDGIELRAVHVNHGLHPDAERWAERAAAQCAALGIDCEGIEVSLPAGGNVEERALDARYGVMADRLSDDDCLLTAHHRDDQAETLILQLMRGAGPAGLAAMPARAPLARGWHLRPWLDVPRRSLADYAVRYGLVYVSDPGNEDEALDRNFVRRRLLPLIESRWPGAHSTLARSARLAAGADALLGELALIDAGRLDQPVLDLAPLAALGPARVANALRVWLRTQGVAPPNERRLLSFVGQLRTAAADRLPALSWGDVRLRVYRRRVYLDRQREALPPGWRGTLLPGGALELPAGLGRLTLVESPQGGIAVGDAGAGLTVRFRDGGEKLAGGDRHDSKRLKNLFQEHGVLPWLRNRVPLVFAGDDLVAVAGIEPAGRSNTSGYRVCWDGGPARLTAA